PMTRHFGIGNIVWSPLEGGWLTGKYRKGAENPQDTPRAKQWFGDLDDPKFRRRLEVVELLLPIAEAKGIPLARFATAWVLRNPDVTSVIIGPRIMEHLEQSLAALEVEITPEEAEQVDALVSPETTVL
ncbi:MAG: aldo/keto reductase, partial [bacterium]|nr:aldo/keto reductase [bacterium]